MIINFLKIEKINFANIIIILVGKFLYSSISWAVIYVHYGYTYIIIQ